MEKINYNLINEDENIKDDSFSYAEYIYTKRTKEGAEILKYRTRYISTIDIPFGRYVLK